MLRSNRSLNPEQLYMKLLVSRGLARRGQPGRTANLLNDVMRFRDRRIQKARAESKAAIEQIN